MKYPDRQAAPLFAIELIWLRWRQELGSGTVNREMNLRTRLGHLIAMVLGVAIIPGPGMNPDHPRLFTSNFRLLDALVG